MRTLIDSIATMLEPCVEAAGFLRERLGVPGLTFNQALAFRDKTHMYANAARLGFAMPPMCVLGADDRGRYAHWDRCVLKPSRACGNLGVRLISSLEKLPTELRQAKQEARLRCVNSEFFDASPGKWLVSAYVEGKEIEVDMYVCGGEVKFIGIHQKTLLSQHGTKLQEDNALTPPLDIPPEQLWTLHEACNGIAQRVSAAYFEPAGQPAFVLYLEFRLAPDGKLFCLEIASRVGGGWLPLAYQRAVGVDTFDLAAAATLRQDVVLPQTPSLKRAVYWQLIYSHQAGTFVGLEGTARFTDRELLYVAAPGTRVVAPSSDYVAGIMVEADTPARASLIARDKLSSLQVVMAVGPGNNHVRNGVPLPEVVSSA